LIKTIKEDIKEGSICENCYSKWKRILKKDPKMNLTKLYCGICKLEEPQTTFSEKFQKVDGTNVKSLQRLTGTENVIHGPICQQCDSKYLTDVKEEKTCSSKVNKEQHQVVDLRKFFQDEFLTLPEISKINFTQKYFNQTSFSGQTFSEI
jgi:hypothetical protein